MVPGSTTLELLEASRGFFPKVLKPDWRLNLRSFRLIGTWAGLRCASAGPEAHESPSRAEGNLKGGDQGRCASVHTGHGPVELANSGHRVMRPGTLSNVRAYYPARTGTGQVR